MDFSITQLYNTAFPELQDYEGWSEEILPSYSGSGGVAIEATGEPSFTQDVVGRRYYLPQKQTAYGIAISYLDFTGTMHYWSIKAGAEDWDRVTPVVPHERCWPTGAGIDPIITWEGGTLGDMFGGFRTTPVVSGVRYLGNFIPTGGYGYIQAAALFDASRIVFIKGGSVYSVTTAAPHTVSAVTFGSSMTTASLDYKMFFTTASEAAVFVSAITLIYLRDYISLLYPQGLMGVYRSLDLQNLYILLRASSPDID
jgi:hypothetical protein